MIAENLQKTHQRIASACKRVGRDPAEVTLIAVTKAFSTQQIRQVLDTGIYDIGENYVQELQRKHAELNDARIRWHFIGHLQSNKVKYITKWIFLIHSVDSLKLGKEISRWGTQFGRTIDCLVEVNTTGETTKFGVSLEQAPSFVKELVHLPNMNVAGLMTIGPLLPDPEQCRPAFQMLRGLRDSLESEGLKLPHLSMGMTNDFEVAIEEGATMVRIGTAIFGERPKVK